MNIDKDTAWKILCEDLNVMKVCAKMVLKARTPEQKEPCKECYVDILQQLDAAPNLFFKVITCDEI